MAKEGLESRVQALEEYILKLEAQHTKEYIEIPVTTPEIEQALLDLKNVVSNLQAEFQLLKVKK